MADDSWTHAFNVYTIKCLHRNAKSAVATIELKVDEAIGFRYSFSIEAYITELSFQIEFVILLAMATPVADIFSFKNKNKKCWPTVRTELTAMALEAFENGETEKGIFYESKALYCEFIANQVYHNSRGNRNIDDFTLTNVIKPDNEPDIFLNYVAQKKIGFSSCNEEDQNKNENSECSDDVGVQKLFEKCNQLPAEWNVVQLAKSFIKCTPYGTTRDIHSEPTPISITLFRHPLSKQMDNKPLNVHFEFGDEATGILAAAYELFEVTFKEYDATFHNKNVQQRIKTQLSEIISNIKRWLGPWVVFFTGKIKGEAGQQMESKLFDQIDKFATKNGVNRSEQKLLLKLASRRIDLLDSHTIKVAAENIADTLKQYSAIEAFLANIKLSFENKSYSYYPCILILDEYLDKIPWEMFAPNEEIARFSSIYLLFDIYDDYKNDISDGYLKIRAKTGNALINPGVDTKLADMEKRITDFVSKWTPDWKQTVGDTPVPSFVNELYASADVFFYAGHGPSLQFADINGLVNVKTKTIMLLFGCESNAIKLHGPLAGPTSTHLTLHNCKCPAIYGANSIISDIWSDMWSITLLRYWIPSTQSRSFKPILIGDDHQKLFLPVQQKFDNKTEPSILRIAAEIRQLPGLLLRMKAAFVYRGFPMYNILAESWA